MISKRIEHLRRDNEKITQTLIALDGTDLEHHADNFKHLAIDAALRSELIICRMRHLLYDYTDVRKPEYLTDPLYFLLSQYTD